MKTKLLKGLSLLLTVSLLVVSASFVSSALGSGDTGASDTSVTSDSSKTEAPVLYSASGGDQLETNDLAPALGYLAASDGSVELDGTNAGEVTVSLVATKDFTCYGIEGTWATKELEETEYFSLNEISSEVLTFNEDNFDFKDVKSGEVMWTDLTFTAGTISADAKLLTATYSVAADTPEGTYTVNFVNAVFTGEDGEPDETEPVFTATITVTHKAATTGLKGDVDLDGDVDMDDVVALMSHVLEDKIITDSVALDNGEVTNDSTCNMDDVVKIMRYVLSDIPTLD